MSEETTEQQDAEAEEPQTDEHRKAQEAEERHERARATMEELEKDPPKKLEDWPDDEAKYETFGGSDTESDYDDKHEDALGKHSVRHLDDGSVEVKGEKVDNPDEFKGEPIPGGPTDPDAPPMPGEEKTREAAAQKQGDGGDDDAEKKPDEE